MSSLDRGQVEQTLTAVLARVPDAEVRLVGTASSLLRGIDLPVGDIDFLFHDRAGVDAWFRVLADDHDVESAPSWIADAQQYFARVHVGGVSIELSTVELETESDAMECVGAGPWRYFDLVACGTATVPCVATELRLITELARAREDRYRPIIDHVRVTGCDVGLIRRGLENVGVARDDIERLVTELSRAGGRD